MAKVWQKLLMILFGTFAGIVFILLFSLCLRMQTFYLSHRFAPDPLPPAAAQTLASGRLDGPGVFHVFRRPGIDDYWEIYRLYEKDPRVGVKLRPNASSRHQTWNGEKKIFDVEYHTDENRRRIVSNTKGKKDHFVAFFGCSFTFGNGLSDDQTLASQLTKFDKRAQIYNYGVAGTGPNHLLAQMETREFKKEITETKGIAIYTFLEDHIQRAIGNSFWTANMPDMPYYEIKNGIPVFKGSFAEGRKIISSFYGVFNELEVAKTWNMYLPPIITSSHENYVMTLIKASFNVFQKQFPESKIYATIFPATTLDKIYKYENLFYKSGIPFIPATVINLPLEKRLIPLDNHPSAELNKYLAEKLSERPELQFSH